MTPPRGGPRGNPRSQAGQPLCHEPARAAALPPSRSALWLNGLARVCHGPSISRPWAGLSRMAGGLTDRQHPGRHLWMQPGGTLAREPEKLRAYAIPTNRGGKAIMGRLDACRPWSSRLRALPCASARYRCHGREPGRCCSPARRPGLRRLPDGSPHRGRRAQGSQAAPDSRFRLAETNEALSSLRAGDIEGAAVVVVRAEVGRS